MRGNVPREWAWFCNRELGVPEAADLFEDVAPDTALARSTRPPSEVVEHIRTTSSYLELDDDRRKRLEQRLREIIESAGGYRSTIYALLVTARAVPARP